MPQEPTQPLPMTCLFTGQPLSATTKKEHTIPDALGGRIQSAIVSCDAFNEAAGNNVDLVLARTYCHLFNLLGPNPPSISGRPFWGYINNRHVYWSVERWPYK